jgi:lipopolysaccharide/colanic/teichoic acid biosynthesis glycosyltransferase
VKRFFDFSVASIGLLLTIPLFSIIGIFIKIESKGPVFFRQVRVGRYGKLFRIYKFRTMFVDPIGNDPEITVQGNIRITKLGKILREYKLDELPQLINVWSGNMSLVGPRPEVPIYVSYYPGHIRSLVLSVRPGITSRAAIEFVDEAMILSRSPNPNLTYINEILPVKLKYYTEYVENQSFIEDLRCIHQTLMVVYCRKLFFILFCQRQ